MRAVVVGVLVGMSMVAGVTLSRTAFADTTAPSADSARTPGDTDSAPGAGDAVRTCEGSVEAVESAAPTRVKVCSGWSDDLRCIDEAGDETKPAPPSASSPGSEATGVRLRIAGCDGPLTVSPEDAIRWGLLAAVDGDSGLLDRSVVGRRARIRVQGQTVLSLEWVETQTLPAAPISAAAPADTATAPPPPSAATPSPPETGGLVPGAVQVPLEFEVYGPIPQDSRQSRRRARSRKALHAVGGVAVGLGVASLIAGTVLGVKARAKEKQSEDYCEPDNPAICSHRGVVMIEDAKALATAANVAFGVGGITLFGGLALRGLAPDPSSAGNGTPGTSRTASASRGIHRGSVTLSLEGHF